MTEAYIARMWGKADGFEIEFKECPDGKWRVNVPPDLSDGVYAAEINVINNYGKTAFWTGELYMCNGVCCLKLHAPSRRLIIRKALPSFRLQIKQTGHKLIIRKGCSHV